MTTEQTIDVTRLSELERRAVNRLIRFLSLKTSNDRQHGRFELVVSDGRIKNVSMTDVIAPREI